MRPPHQLRRRGGTVSLASTDVRLRLRASGGLDFTCKLRSEINNA